MIGTLLSLIPAAVNLVEGIAGKSASDDLAERVRNSKLRMPAEMNRAEGVARQLAYMGLPGYEKYREDINQTTPNTVNQLKQVAQSPSQIIDMISRSQVATNEALGDLAVKDAEFNVAGKRNYQNFLEQKGAMQLGIDRNNLETGLAADYQQAQGTADLFQSLSNAVASGVNTYGMLSTLNSQEDYLTKLGDSYGVNKSLPFMGGVDNTSTVYSPSGSNLLDFGAPPDRMLRRDYNPNVGLIGG